MKQKLVLAAASLAGLLVLAVLGLPLVMDADHFRPQLEQALGDALGRKVSVGRIRTALFSGGVALDDLAIADDPAFGSRPFVTARSVSVGVDLRALIFSRSLRVTSFRLDEPHVVLTTTPAGQWNFSGLAGGTPGSNTSPSAAPATAAAMMVERVEIANGRVTLADASHPGASRDYEGVNLEVSNLSLASQFPFRASAKAPGGGTLTLDGQAGPFNTADTAETPFQATVTVEGVDVAATGLVDSKSGLAGRVSFAGSLASDGKRLTSKGTLTAVGLQMVPEGKPARVPVEVVYESDYRRESHAGVVKQGDVHIGKAVAHLTGEYDASGDAPVLHLKLTGDDMPAPDLEATLPALGAALPSGASIRHGTLDANFTISGPMNRLVIAGSLNLANVAVGGFDLSGKLGVSGKLGALPSFGGAGKSGGTDTAIETLAVSLRVAPEGIRADDIRMLAPAIGTLTGRGTVSPKGDLDFKMVAMPVESSLSAVSLGGPGGGIPFRIEGTTANPLFVPDVRQAARDLAANPAAAKKAATALGGLFRGKNR
jgi:AsmA protein